MEKFNLSYLPFPVSTNAATKNVGSRGRAKSEKYHTYIKEMAVWKAMYRGRLRRCQEFLKLGKGFLVMEIFLVMPSDYLYTKKGNLRQIDSSNYIKCLEDVLCKILNYDDKEHLEVRCGKYINPNIYATKSFVAVDFYFKDNIIYGGTNEIK